MNNIPEYNKTNTLLLDLWKRSMTTNRLSISRLGNISRHMEKS
jgi:hypothetical protein